MGLDHTGTRLLLYARSCGVDFEKTIMVGRQGLHLASTTLANNLAEFGIGSVDADALLSQAHGYAEPFLKVLGAKTVDSIDASGYESATVIHDMNLPVTDGYKQSFDVVLDGGSLEHIFNFPVAIRNCMEMVKLNGHFLGITPTNNFLGHGFYQFSPELFFRVFSAENGFRLERMLFFVEDDGTEWYEVKDPNEVKERVTLCNSRRSYLFVIARKIAEANIFANTPQQSDYQHIHWTQRPPQHVAPAPRSIATRIGDRIASSTRRLSILFKETGAANTGFFSRVSSKDRRPLA